jgi:hypothetical protein
MREQGPTSAHPLWSRVEGKSQVNLPQMPLRRSGILMGVDLRNHTFAPGLPQEGRRMRERGPTSRAAFSRMGPPRNTGVPCS